MRRLGMMVAVMVVTAGLAGCATQEAMTVSAGTIGNPSPKYRNAIAVRTVSGGAAMNVLTQPGVSNEPLKAALEDSLRANGYLASGTPRYYVDAEVKKVIDRSYNRAMQTLQDNLGLLHKVAEALLERETLSREDIEMLSRGESLPPRTPGGMPPNPTAPATTPILEPRRSPPPLLGGPEPSPA